MLTLGTFWDPVQLDTGFGMREVTLVPASTYGHQHGRREFLDALDVLRKRHLGRKRDLALKEHGLGLDALVRFVGGDPLWEVHQRVFAVLALESEPMDPRL